MRLFILSISVFFFFSCSKYQKILKSDNLEFQYSQAVQFYNNEDYTRSVQLLEKLLTSFNDRDKKEEVYYYYSYSVFNIKDYTSAAYHFKNFNLKFPYSKKNEEIAFMSAYCYYMQSPRYNLDQQKTYEAIDQLQLFISNYQNSDRVSRANELIFDLNIKLEKKDFEIVKSYYETSKYRSAIYAIDDFLVRYPETVFLEDVGFIQLQAYYELGKNSVEEKKEQRVKEAIFACDNFLLAFPSGNYKKETESIYKKLKEIQNGL